MGLHQKLITTIVFNLINFWTYISFNFIMNLKCNLNISNKTIS